MPLVYIVVSFFTFIHVLFDYLSLVHIIVDASFRCSDVLQYWIVINTDCAQTNVLQFFIVNGVCEMNGLF